MWTALRRCRTRGAFSIGYSSVDRIFPFLCVCVYVCVFVFVCVCVFVFVFVFVCVSVFVFVSVYVFVSV